MWYLDDYNVHDSTTRTCTKIYEVKKIILKMEKYKNILENIDVLIFNGNLWHGGSSKSSGQSKMSINYLGMQDSFIKPSYDYMLNTPLNTYN